MESTNSSNDEIPPQNEVNNLPPTTTTPFTAITNPIDRAQFSHSPVPTPAQLYLAHQPLHPLNTNPPPPLRTMPPPTEGDTEPNTPTDDLFRERYLTSFTRRAREAEDWPPGTAPNTPRRVITLAQLMNGDDEDLPDTDNEEVVQENDEEVSFTPLAHADEWPEIQYTIVTLAGLMNGGIVQRAAHTDIEEGVEDTGVDIPPIPLFTSTQTPSDILTSLPRVYISTTHRPEGLSDEEYQRLLAEMGEKCAVCQEEFQEGYLTGCGHVSCVECAVVWGRISRRCGTCRRVVLYGEGRVLVLVKAGQDTEGKETEGEKGEGEDGVGDSASG